MGKGLSKCDFLNVDELERRIQELRGHALKTIDDSHKKYGKGGGSCINDEGLQLFLHQIKNKMLLVAVVGEGSSGKSTLVNAFLRDKILPSGIGRVTGFRIFIGHDTNVHKDPCESSTGHCDECPYLVRGIQKRDVLCHGVKNIKERITEENRQLDDENRKDPLVLYTYIPVFDSLSSSSHCTPYFVDSPGVEVINDDVKSYYSILSAMIYVENYQRLLQNEENITKELGCKPENASLFFAVSHFDKYYTSSADEPNPNEEETKAKVESNIKLQVKHEEVFPVCGLWALHAHLAIKYNPSDDISRVVEEAYNWIPKSKILDRISNKASCILNISAIRELEKNLKCSIGKTNFQQWNILMYRQCLKFLEGPIQAGDTVLHIIESKIVDSLKDIEEIKVKIECLKNLEEGVQKYVSEELEENIQHVSSSFFTRRVSPRINEGMRTFRSSCIDSVNNNYTFGQYLEDWDVFRRHDLSDLIKEELDNETKRCVGALECKVQEKYNMLVRHILGHDPQSVTFIVEAEIQEVDSHSVGKPSKNIKDFVSDRTKDKKLWNYLWGIVSAGAGVIVSTGAGISGYLAVMALPAVFAAVPVIISSGAIIAGLSGATYFITKGLSTKDQNMKLSEEEVETLCDRMNSEITSKMKRELEKAVKYTLSDYNKSLKAEYDTKWGSKLNQDLEEAQALLACIQQEKTELTQALDELKEYSKSLRDLVE